ncbi:DoxX family protein [Croceitalea dokdonensis DOKDO 023]|uniref:DoxX family protein n=1 Tax=Croceitalea dokdonensis DOKDO 023 TaxID=1300341 RepID=A0A0P7AXK0_9FLAO|nr:DoxX family protein [Croceitalea dokdonensis]KPM33526.1 DoxX family protein [Croceitalea dokdonensis DOKDO 023]
MKTKALQQLGLALLRIIPSSFMIFAHGLGKFQKLIAGDFTFADPIGIGPAPSLFLAVVGEVVAPLLIIVGFKTRLAAIPAFITMFVAAFITHGTDPFGKKELALLYAVFFLVIFLVGPGKYSIDKK